MISLVRAILGAISYFDSFLTSDSKNRHVSRLLFNASSGYEFESYPEDALKINVKHVGFLNQMSGMNQNEIIMFNFLSI